MNNTTLTLQPVIQHRLLKKIGIFDSGIGGISILKQLMHLDGLELVYVADTAHVPYGNRSQQEIQQLAHYAITFLLQQQVDTIIIACHTVATNALEYLKITFPSIKFIDVANLVVQETLTKAHKTVGILATQATTNSGIHKKMLLESKPELTVITQACPRLASAIEKEYTNVNKLKNLVQCYLKPLIQAHIDTLILGCTHYALIQKQIAALIDPAICIISAEQSIQQHLTPFITSTLPVQAPIYWYATGNTKYFKQVSSLIIEETIPQVVKISQSIIAI